MAQYDGSIRINTDISTKAAKKSLGTLSNMITLTAKEISSLRSKMDALKGQKFYTDDYKKLQADLAEAEKKLAEFTDLAQSSSVKNENQQKAVNEQIEKYKANIESIKGKMQALESEGKAFTLGTDTAEYKNYERQLQYEQAALAEATKQYQAMDKLKDPYGRLSQAVSSLNEKLIKILGPIQKVRSAFSQDVNASGYEKFGSSLEEVKNIAGRVGESFKKFYADLKENPIHTIADTIQNMANRANSAIGSFLSGGLEKFGENIGAIAEKARQMASNIGSGISSALDVAKEKLAGFAGNAINTILHPFQTLKNVASITLNGIASIVKGGFFSALEGLKNRAAGLGASLINGLVHPFQTLKNIAGGAIKGVNKLFSGMVSIAKKAEKAISSMSALLKRATSSMLGFGKSTKTSNNNLQLGIKSILKYGLGIRSLYALFNKLRAFIKEGFSNLYNDANIESFKNTVDSLKGSLLTLKNAFAAAFRPLVEIAIPYIQKAIEYLTLFLDKVGQVIAAISGQKTYTKAIKQTTAAIKEQNKAQSRQLSSLDKLNNLTSDKGAGADSGGVGGMFEEVPVSSKFADIAQWLKDMWNKANFTELGTLLGKKLKNALDSIDWEPIKQAAAKIGKSIGTLINGFVEVKGLGESIGKTIGEAINTGIAGINAFFDNTHWDSVGRFIGEALNGLVDTISWEDIGHFFAARFNAIFETIGEAARTFDWFKFGQELADGFNTFISDFDWEENGARLGDLIKGFLDTFIAFLENTNWQELGSNVADFIGSIDWTGLFERLAEGIGAVLGGIGAFIVGLIGDSFAEGVGSSFFADKINEAGGNIAKGIYNGITEGLANIGRWIKEHIFQPFIDGFKNAFGIHSPSTVMAEIGGYIIQGLLNGLKDMWSDVASWIDDKVQWVKDTFSSIKDSVSGFFSGGVFSGGFGKSVSTFSTRSIQSSYAANPAFATLNSVPIPRLATGAVIPANREFLAVLGDQKHGTNIEAPLDTITQANEKAILNVFSKLGISAGNNRNSGNERFVFQVDGKTFFEIMRKEAEQYFKCTGRSAFPI